ncbi:MAG: hypothetical protein ACR2RF_13670 [Geminicoccaceae bacterium]
MPNISKEARSPVNASGYGATCLHQKGQCRLADGAPKSLDDLVDDLVGADVDASELKAQIRKMLQPAFEVFSGAKSGVSYLVETSGVDEQSVTEGIVMQHCGLLNRDGQKPCEPETSS